MVIRAYQIAVIYKNVFSFKHSASYLTLIKNKMFKLICISNLDDEKWYLNLYNKRMPVMKLYTILLSS